MNLNEKLVESDMFDVSTITSDIDVKDITFLKNKTGSNVVLGQGAFSVVYLGMYKDCKVAMKCFNDINVMIKNEIQITKKLNHDHVLKYFGTFYDSLDEKFYLVSEFAECGTLKDWIKNDSFVFPKSFFNKVQIMKEILNGININ
jgi:serine/threonine protein kinase